MERIARRFLIIALVLLVGCSPAAKTPDLVAPNVFLRALQLNSGARYAATFVKPTDETVMQDVVVEITIPSSAKLTGMTVPRQSSAAEVRENGATRTLAWRVAQVEAGQALDTFSFSVEQPLDDGLEFYMSWRNASGAESVEHFTENPPIQAASDSEARVTLSQPGYVPVGASGVQISAGNTASPLQLAARVLPPSANPPPEYGQLWWCSMVEITGVPAGQSVLVMAPLRRPVAPFTQLSLFRQNADGSWSPLEGMGVVTADGLFVEYEHPGGVVALGGDPSLQPESVTLVSSGDNGSLTVGSGAAAPTSEAVSLTLSGSGGDVTASGSAPTLPADPAATPDPNLPASTIADGTSNTLLIGEAGSTPTESPVFVTLAPFETAAPDPNATLVQHPGGVNPAPTDGSVRFVTLAPFETATPDPNSPSSQHVGAVNSTPADGSVRFVTLAPFETATPTLPPGQPGVTDGTSNTLLFGESTPSQARTPSAPQVQVITATPSPQAPAPATVTSTPRPAATLAPAIVVNPTIQPARILPIGSGGVRVIIQITTGGVVQCQAGGAACAALNRIRK